MTYCQRKSPSIILLFQRSLLSLLVVLTTTSATHLNGDSIRSSSCPILLPMETRQLNPSGRIKGGDSTIPLSYMVYLLGGTGPARTCTGTLISSSWVLTAAHCQITINHVARIGGGTKRSGARHNIIQVVSHPSFDGIQSESDLALVELDQKVSSDLLPAALAGTTQVPRSESIARVQGFGRRATLGPVENNSSLQFVDVPVLKTSICAEAYPDRKVSSKTVCAAYINSNTCTPCKGDSGGPLIQYNRNGRAVVVGLVSAAAPGCGVVRSPIVYVRIGAFVGWIKNIVQDVEIMKGESVLQVQLSGGVVSLVDDDDEENEENRIRRTTFVVVLSVAIPMAVIIGCLITWIWWKCIWGRRRKERMDEMEREKIKDRDIIEDKPEIIITS